MEYRILDLFCGAGGFSLGLEMLPNFTTKIGVDYDNHAISTFKENFKYADIVIGDLKDQKIKNKIIKLSKKENINMIIGGPPCQGFSLKGKNLGLEDARNYLFLEYHKIVKELTPDLFIIENVKNLINSENNYFITEIKHYFENLGYYVDYGILDSSNFGVPQKRERAIIIGSLYSSIPIPKNTLTCPKVNVRDAISDLAYLSSGEGKEKSLYKYNAKSNYQKKMRANSSILQYHKATNHTEETIEKLKFIPPEGDKKHLPQKYHGKQKFSTTWSRLIWDELSPTIDTRFDTPSNGRNTHPNLHRAITPREAARIQSFPDTFIFMGTKSSICKQIGNAVPPLLSKAIGKHIINELQHSYINSSNNYKIINGDAYFKIKEFQRNKLIVNHIITDPPYNISKSNNFNTLKNPRKGIDFGTWDNGAFDLFSWIGEYVNILDKNGSMIIFASYRYISYLITELENNNMIVKDIIMWQKSNPMPRNIDRRYVQDTEFAIWAVKKRAKWVFNKQPEYPYHRGLFKSSTVSGKEKTGHPTQKSLSLMEHIIKIHTNKGETILDPFMGSGTTGVAALNLNRKFVGIERDNDYYNIALKRLKHIE